jgi:hypothetical protein
MMRPAVFLITHSPDSLLLNNVFFDTCVYHQQGVDLLTSVIPVENVLFASEMIGAVIASTRCLPSAD